MVANPQSQVMTPQEYLEWEEKESLKYEYEDVIFINDNLDDS
jgi:hypothetical protein